LAAIHAIPAEEVIVLPNSPNVVRAAEKAAALSDRVVQVVPSRSPQAGLAAAITLDPTRSVEENAQVMEATLERVRTGAVAPAARDDVRGRFRQGDAVGFVEEEMVVWGEPRATLQRVVERLSEDAELITLLRGANAPLDDQAVYELAHDGVELELSDGGQPNYWWLLSAE
jgi:dihydroxyacetone kinase-like predicted kinase